MDGRDRIITVLERIDLRITVHDWIDYHPISFFRRHLSKIQERLAFERFRKHVAQLLLCVNLENFHSFTNIRDKRTKPMHFAVVELRSRSMLSGIKVGKGQCTVVVFPYGYIEVRDTFLSEST